MFQHYSLLLFTTNLAYSKQAIVLLCLAIFVCVFALIINHNKTYNDQYINRSVTVFPIKTARLLLLFGAFMPALTGGVYSFIVSEFNITFFIAIVFGIIAFSLYLLSFKVQYLKTNINLVIKWLFYIFIILTLFNNYLTQLHAFYFSSILVTSSLATIMIDRVKPYFYFAFTVTVIAAIVAWLVDKPEVDPFVFVLCILCQLIIVYLMILVKLNLNDKLLFADDAINNGNSLVLAANDKGDIVYVSKNFERILGYSEAEIMGQGWWKIRSKDEAQNKKEQDAIVKMDNYDSVVSKVIAKDDKAHWISWLNKRMDNGLIVGIGSDITEEKALQEKYQNMVENAVDIIYTINNNGVFTYCNQAVLAVTGYVSNELMGLTYLDLIQEDWRMRTAEFYYGQLKNKIAESYFEFPAVTKNKQTIWLGQTVTSVIDKNTNTLTGFQCVARDVTTRVLAEQALENNRKQLEIRNTIVQKILASASEEQMIKEVLLQLKQDVVATKHYGLSMYNLEKNIGTTTFIDSHTNYEFVTASYDLSETSSILTLHQNKIYYCENLALKTNPSIWEIKQLSEGAHTLIAIPIYIKNTLYGAMHLSHTAINAFNEQHQQLFKEIADNIAINISRVRYSDIITEINNDVNQNIAYAKRIQQAIIPPQNYLQQYIPQSFLYLKQRDTIGGDFYFVTQRDQYTFLALGDCTGHGVSGALLTVLSTNYLTQAISELRLIDPALIIEHLNTSITHSLNRNNTNDIRDGLDLCMCVIDAKAKAMFFAGAMNSIYVIKNKHFMEYKATRMTVGGLLYDFKQNYYETCVIPYVEGMQVYLSTDGYTDQISPIENKKYGKIKFKELLKNIATLTISEQLTQIENTHEQWKRNMAQTDDIGVIGFKF
jgi:PAS domain S-box-containing protein